MRSGDQHSRHLATEAEQVDPGADDNEPEVVVKRRRVLQPEDEDVAKEGHRIEEQDVVNGTLLLEQCHEEAKAV